MKVCVVYERESWEIRGIEAIFSSREKAVEYLAANYSTLSVNEYENYLQEAIVE